MKNKNKTEDLANSPTNKKNPNKHGRCVPLDIYQKVYNDRSKLQLELENLNNKLKASINDDNNILLKIYKMKRMI